MPAGPQVRRDILVSHEVTDEGWLRLHCQQGTFEIRVGWNAAPEVLAHGALVVKSSKTRGEYTITVGDVLVATKVSNRASRATGTPEDRVATLLAWTITDEGALVLSLEGGETLELRSAWHWPDQFRVPGAEVAETFTATRWAVSIAGHTVASGARLTQRAARPSDAPEPREPRKRKRTKK